MLDGDGPQGGFLPFAQSPIYGAAATACGATAFQADLGVGRALVVQRGRMRLITRGPVWQSGSAADHRAAIRRFARWPGLTVVTPEEGLGVLASSHW